MFKGVGVADGVGATVGASVADGVGVADGDKVTDAEGVAALVLEAVLVDTFAADGVGDAVGPLHPAAITQKSNTAHTANVAVRFFVKLTPRRSDGSLRMQKDLLQHT
jgi:hypothetical protein